MAASNESLDNTTLDFMCRPTLSLDMLRASMQLGIDPPSMQLPGPGQLAEVWRVARFTDALSAYNILQVGWMGIWGVLISDTQHGPLLSSWPKRGQRQGLVEDQSFEREGPITHMTYPANARIC